MRYALLVLVVALAGQTTADTVYKWVAPDGSITFSSTPPPEGETVEAIEEVQIAPPPTEIDRQDAERRRKAMQDLAAEMERDRKARAAEAKAARAAPPPPAPPPLPPARAPTGTGGGEPLVYDDWWTGPARPVALAPLPEPAPEPSRPFFTPAPLPAFH